MRISDFKVIQHFTNNYHGTIHGVYSANFNGESKVIVRNEDSFGAISYFLNEPVSKCLSIIRNDVKEEIIECLHRIGLE